jgi:hypothetical protein
MKINTKQEITLLFTPNCKARMEELYRKSNSPSFSIFVEKLVSYGIREFELSEESL